MKNMSCRKPVSSALSGKFSSTAEKANARDAFIFHIEDHTKFAVLKPLALLYHLG